jgi:GNAT superfamily N-acetyltransferase
VSNREPVDIVLQVVVPSRDKDLLRVFYEEVMIPAFRPEELGGPFWDEADDTPSRTILALDEFGSPLGGIVGELFPSSGVLLIAWLAVRKDARGHGVGTRLMEAASHEWWGKPEHRLVLGELDDPRYWPSDNQDPVDRLRFYDRFGIMALDRPYFQPSVGAGFGIVPHMFLATFNPTAPAIRDGDRVDGQVVRRFLQEYLEGSSVLSGGDGTIDEAGEWLLSFYDGSDIPLVPLLEYERIADPETLGRDS